MQFKLWLESVINLDINNFNDLLIAMDYLEDYPHRTSGTDFARFSIWALAIVENKLETKVYVPYNINWEGKARELRRAFDEAFKGIKQYNIGIPPAYNPEKFEKIKIPLEALAFYKEARYLYASAKKFLQELQSFSYRFVKAFEEAEKVD